MAADTAPAAPTEGAPAEGLAPPAEDHGPWDLSGVAPELLPHVREALKKAEGGVTQKFQEHAQFKQQAEPLLPLAELKTEEGLGVLDVPQEDLVGLIDFWDLAQDPEQFKDWWTGTGKELGFLGDDGQPAEMEGSEEQMPQWAQDLQTQLEELKGGFQEFSGTQAEQQVLGQIEADFQRLEAENPDLPWDDQQADIKDKIAAMAISYGNDPEAIQKAFADFQALWGAAQGTLVSNGERQPGQALSGGSGDATPPEVKGFGGAKEVARERLRQANRQ